MRFLTVNNTGSVFLYAIADRTQRKDRLISLTNRAFAASSHLYLTLAVIINHLLLEVVSFLFVFGAF